VRLPGQAVDLLCLLLERPGELTTREEIERRLWPDRNVDFAHSLDVIVSRLRTALGDKGSSPRYIQTVPRKGYRFIEPVTAKPEARLPNRRWRRRLGLLQPSRFSQRFWRCSLRALATTSLFRLTVRAHRQRCRLDDKEENCVAGCSGRFPQLDPDGGLNGTHTVTLDRLSGSMARPPAEMLGPRSRRGSIVLPRTALNDYRSGAKKCVRELPLSFDMDRASGVGFRQRVEQQLPRRFIIQPNACRRRWRSAERQVPAFAPA
jgi:hypothetical protein